MLKEVKRKWEEWRRYAKIRRKNKSIDSCPGEGINAADLSENVLFQSREVRCCNHTPQVIGLNIKKKKKKLEFCPLQ